jgi:hypothetical protein
MSLASVLTIAALLLVGLAVGLLAWLAITQPGFSFQGIWARALAGHKPSRLYMALVLLAFALALAAQVLRIVESRNSRPQSAASPGFSILGLVENISWVHAPAYAHSHPGRTSAHATDA